MFDASEENQDPQGGNQALQKTNAHLFPFDKPQTVVLKNGTVHKFGLPSEKAEKRKESVMRTVIVTSPAKVNGQNPRTITTDYSKAMLRYYSDVVDTVQGYALNEGDDPNVELDAQMVVDTDNSRPQPVEITVADIIPTKDRRAAAERLYGGRIQIVKPKLKEGEKQVVVLRSKRLTEITQEIGVEQNDDGSFTEPTHVIHYFYKEAGDKHLSKWETGCFNGHSVGTSDGGSREERTYNLDAVCALFDGLIDRIEGASVEDREIDVRISAHLEAVPKAIKKTQIALLMNDVVNDAGN